MVATINVPFGLADVTLNDGATPTLKIDGVNYLQVKGVDVQIKPKFKDINFADFGSSKYDAVIDGYDAKIKLVLGQNDVKIIEKFFSFHAPIVQTATTVGVMDEKIGSSIRAKAVPLRIHPRAAGADASFDMVLYKVAGTGDYGRKYENDQGDISIELDMFPRDGFDASKPGNFYYIGSVDPATIV